jgi:hypothetical protein
MKGYYNSGCMVHESDASIHLNPLEDDSLGDHWAELITNRVEHNYHFGFESFSSLRKWFYDVSKFKNVTKQLQISVYSVDKDSVINGDTQLIFNDTNPVHLYSLSCDALLDSPEYYVHFERPSEDLIEVLTTYEEETQEVLKVNKSLLNSVFNCF